MSYLIQCVSDGNVLDEITVSWPQDTFPAHVMALINIGLFMVGATNQRIRTLTGEAISLLDVLPTENQLHEVLDHDTCTQSLVAGLNTEGKFDKVQPDYSSETHIERTRVGLKCASLMDSAQSFEVHFASKPESAARFTPI